MHRRLICSAILKSGGIVILRKMLNRCFVPAWRTDFWMAGAQAPDPAGRRNNRFDPDPIHGRSNRLHNAGSHADTPDGRCRSEAFVVPFCFAPGQNHDPMKSLNRFRVRLLDLEVVKDSIIDRKARWLTVPRDKRG